MTHRFCLRAFIGLTLFTCCFAHTLTAQTEPADSMFLSLHRKDVATVGTILWSSAAVFMEFQWWWRDDYIYQRHAFRVQDDGYFFNKTYGIDKLGHLYASYLIFGLTYDVMKWAHFDDNTALWAAVVVPASHALAIELGDGFSKWAFNFSDLYFNTTGIVYGALQKRYPYLQNFTYKWSYYPSPSGGKDDQDWGPASDYSGHIYWISIDMHNVLPENMKEYWPPWLNLGLGMGAKNVSFGDTGVKQHTFAVSLDWNTNYFLPDGDTFQIFKNLINKFRLPAPGVKIYSGDQTLIGKPLLLH